MTPSRDELMASASLITADVLAMQMRLYGLRTERRAPVTDADLWALLRELRASRPLDPFRLWLVGSRVEPGREKSDADVVLAPAGNERPPDETMEQALWSCRVAGLSGSTVCAIDPCVRLNGPALVVTRLHADMMLKSIKLFSPTIMLQVLQGRLRNYQRLGRFCIEFDRRAGDTDYYSKLPLRTIDGVPSPYLRPGIEVL